MESVWSAGCKIPSRQRLRGNIKADAAVIGGGMAGILTAFKLKQKGLDVVVLEGRRVASGVTQNTTAKITSQHSLIYQRLIEQQGTEKAKQYAAANQAAVREYEKIISSLNINCSFTPQPAYVYSVDNADQIEKEVQAARFLGIDAEFTEETSLPLKVAGAVKFKEQAHFNPLEFIKVLSEQLTVYEDSFAQEIKDGVIVTKDGRIEAEKIVVATHFPFINAPGYYFARMHQSRSYVIALEGAQQLDGMYIDADENGLSFRNYKDLLLLGGGGHRTGENTLGGCYNKLRMAAERYYPQSSEKFHWSAQDCMPHDGIPYIGNYSSLTPNLYVATGFNKWGMTGSMTAAMILSDLITGRDNENKDVFDPQRFNITSVKGLVKDSMQAVSGLAKQNFSLPEAKLQQVQKGHGGLVEHDGEKVGVYRDQHGAVHLVSTRCPHLGCQLEWNADEHSWDCPCHGSRFDYKGRLLDNPATKDLDTAEDITD